MDVPRLKSGQAYCGAEWFGCVNTFRRAMIARLMLLDGKYVVGFESDVDRAISTLRVYKKMAAGKRSIRWVSGKTKFHVNVFRSRSAAVKRFDELNATVLQFNARERAALAAEKNLARSRKPLIS